MAFIRIQETNFPYSDVNELDLYSGPGSHPTISGAGTISNTRTRAGIYGKSFRSNASDGPRGKLILGGASQISVGYFLNHSGFANSSSKVHLWLCPVGSSFLSIDWENSTNDLIMNLNGSEVVRVAGGALPLTTVNKWYHIGLVFKAHASTGFITMFIDGIPVITLTGNTAAAGTTINGIFFNGSAVNVGTWANYAYYSCFGAYKSPGEANVSPIGHEFFFLPLSALGHYSGNWSAVGAANTLLATAIPYDGDTTYAEAASVLTESWVITTPPVNFLPAGYTITGVIPSSESRRTGTSLTTLELGLRTAAGNEQFSGVEQTLNIGYCEVNDMYEKNHLNANWDISQITGLEVVIKSAGAF